MKPPPPGQFNPFDRALAAAHRESGAGKSAPCGYGCGKLYKSFPRSPLRGHGRCLVELGDDLLMMSERFPKISHERLGLDLGVTTELVAKILRWALDRRGLLPRAQRMTPAPAPAPTGPTRLSERQHEALAQVVRVWRRDGRMVSGTEIAKTLGVAAGTGWDYLEVLRVRGWIDRKGVLHVPSCALACRHNECPTLLRAARAA